LPAALRSGALAELRLCPGGEDTCLVVRGGALRWYRARFWRRTKSLAERATAATPGILEPPQASAVLADAERPGAGW
jgi:hypothetical protein